MTIEGYDAAYAPAHPPVGDQVAMLYIGGDTPHIATLAEWNSQPARYRLPIWTRDNPAGHDGAAEGRAALAKLDQLGAPRGILIGLDYETAVDAAFVAAFDSALVAGGNKTVLYGSKSSVFRNPRPSGGYWTADLTGRPHSYPGAVITQWEFEAGWDDDTLTAGLPLWDTHATSGADMPLTNADADLILNRLIPRAGGRMGGDTTLGGMVAWNDQHVGDLEAAVNTAASGVAAKVDALAAAVAKLGAPAIDTAALASSIVTALGPIVQQAVTAGVQPDYDHMAVVLEAHLAATLAAGK